MIEVAQNAQALGNDVVGLIALDVSDKTNATRVMFVFLGRRGLEQRS